MRGMDDVLADVEADSMAVRERILDHLTGRVRRAVEAGDDALLREVPDGSVDAVAAGGVAVGRDLERGGPSAAAGSLMDAMTGGEGGGGTTH